MSYTINQQNHFSKLINVAFKDINIQQLNTIYYKQLAKKLVKMLQDLPDTVNLDSPFAVAQNQSKIDALFTEINAMMRLRFRSQLSGIWNKAFDLGLKHQVEDILYSNKSIKKLWDKEFKSKKIDSVFSSKTDLVAFFGQKEEIERAEKEYAKLADSLEKVAKTGKYDNLLDDADVLGRYTPLERAYFLDSLIEISNIKRRAEASKYSYVSDQYMRNRLRVLSQDFADKYDNNTKKAVEKFLLKDVRYVRSIQTNNLIARNAIDSVADDLEKQALEVVNQNGGKKLRKLSYENKQPLYARAKAILRTETSIAYNMGKLIGYSSEEDINKKFRWQADWELQDTKDGYVVCDACRYMHNEVFTAKTLLAAAMRADTGIINYKGTRRSKTDFKNPSIPVIPFHPNCSCRFVRVFEPEEDSVGKQQVAVPVNSRGLLRQTQSLNIADTILPKVIGATLLVGGAFMLSRSNTWKKAFTIAQQTKLPAITKTEAVIDAVTYVEEVIGGPAADLTKEVLKDGVKKATASVS
jgi:hypothetical protein